MIIQLVGLPCSGKSTLIKKFIKKNPYRHLDIAKCTSEDREQELQANITSKNTIVESACGISLDTSIVILLKVSTTVLNRNMSKRNEYYSDSELEQIRSQIIPAHYTIYNLRDFEKIIKIIQSEG